jgi:hypothetical protein
VGGYSADSFTRTEVIFNCQFYENSRAILACMEACNFISYLLPNVEYRAVVLIKFV